MMSGHRSGAWLAGLTLATSASAQGQPVDAGAQRLVEVTRLLRVNALDPVDPQVVRNAAIDAIHRQSQRDAVGWAECAGVGSTTKDATDAGTLVRALDCVELPDRRDAAADAAARAMLALTERGSWLTPADFASFARKPASIGLTLRQVDKATAVVRVARNSPAAAAGLKRGDLLTAIDGNPVADLSLDAVISQLRGEDGSAVALTIRRDGRPMRITSLQRVVLTSADYTPVVERLGSVLVISVPALSSGVAKTIADAIEREKLGMTAIVLDLRDNGGGILAEAALVADLFLDKAVMFTQQGRTAHDVETVQAKKGQVAPGTPVVVIVNGETGAGAELVAAALQDNKRALVIGERTAGAGTVQTLIPITGGYAARLTTSYLIRADGKRLADEPVKPDCVRSEDADAPIDRAVAIASAGPAACGVELAR